jgi:hypothetical protein
MENKEYVDRVKTELRDINFPATKQDILQKKGTAQIELAQGRKVTVREALASVQKDRFESQNELLTQINQANSLDWQI